MNLRIFSKGKSDPKPAKPGEVVAFEDAQRLFADDYTRLEAEARRYARQRVGNLWADDVVQEAFMSLWDAYYSKGTPPRERPERLLYRTLRNCIVDRVRSEKSRDPLEDQHTIDITHRLLPRLDSARVADGSLLEARIDYLLGGMPETTSSVFRAAMRYDWDIHAAAAALQLPYNTARGHFLRAKHRLAEALAKDGYSIPPLKPRGRDGGKKS